MTQQAPFFDNTIGKKQFNKDHKIRSGTNERRDPMSESMSKFVAGTLKDEQYSLTGPSSDMLGA